MKDILIKLSWLPAYTVIFLIKIYQKLFSFDHSLWAQPEKFRICTYYPSCSEYTVLALKKHGLIKGSIMGFVRIMSCNPWSHGGHDPVADHFTLKRYAGKGAKPAW